MEFIRAQKISITDYDEFDYILAMDEDNLELVDYYAPSQHKAKTGLFLKFAKAAGLTERSTVPDPYYGGAKGFEDVFELVELGCHALLQHIRLNDLSDQHARMHDGLK
jgi:protein-tyrosine phosphatase